MSHDGRLAVVKRRGRQFAFNVAVADSKKYKLKSESDLRAIRRNKLNLVDNNNSELTRTMDSIINFPMKKLTQWHCQLHYNLLLDEDMIDNIIVISLILR